MLQTINGSIDPLTEITTLKEVVEAIKERLERQHNLLQMRDLDLTQNVVHEMAQVELSMQQLQKSLAEELTELEQLRSLVATSAMINSSLDLDTVLSDAMDEVINLTDAERGYILLKNAGTGELEFRIARVAEHSQSNTDEVGFQVSSTILNEVLTNKQPLLTDNAYKDPRMQKSQTIAQFVLRSVMCVPLIQRDETIGAVYVDNRYKTAVFTGRELNLLTAFANQIAVAIENARLFANVQAALAEITAMKDLMENVFESIASGVITTDAVNYVMTYNNAASRILSHPPENALGRLVTHLLNNLDLDLESYLRAVREENQSIIIEGEPEIPERGRIFLNLKLSPLKDTEQNTQGVAMVLDDLTEQRTREETIGLMEHYLPPGMIDNIQQIASLDLGGERREMTCMFADIAPLHTFPAHLRPSEIMDILNVYLRSATDTVHQLNGLVDKYMGSEVMVLYNTQLNPQQDHALRAIETALDLRDTIVELYNEFGLDTAHHRYHIGVHSGVATVGNVGSLKRRNFTAIGDTINLSKRLQENTQPGQIITSEDTLAYIIQTHGNLPTHIRFEERDALLAKGRKQQTVVYEVFRV